MGKRNPIEEDADYLAMELERARASQDDAFGTWPQAFSKEIEDEDALLLYEHPSLLFPGEAVSDEDARQVMVDVDPEAYVRLGEAYDRAVMRKLGGMGG